MSDRISILHLRQCPSVNALEGATRMMLETIRLCHPLRFRILPCFLVRAKEGGEGARDEVCHGLKCRILPGKRFFDLGVLRSLCRAVRDEEISIIHSHDYKANVYALILKALLPHLRLVGTVHGYIANTRKGAAYCWLDRRILRLFDRIVLVASNQKDFFPSECAEKMNLIPNGVPIERWRRKPVRDEIGGNSERFRVGFAGRISPEKGWREFVEVAARLARENQSFFFPIAGDGPDLAAMRSLVEARGLSDRFEFHGAVDDMPGFYAGLDALLAPSRTEGLPVAQLEANATSVPVVATDVGGVKDLIVHGHNGLVAEKGDVDTLAGHVKTLRENPAFSRWMGANGRRRVASEFSLESQVARLEDLYEQILEENPSGGIIPA